MTTAASHSIAVSQPDADALARLLLETLQPSTQKTGK